MCWWSMLLNLSVFAFQVTVRTDGLQVEPSLPKVEGVKRENAENILAEERDGTSICALQ